MSEAPQEDSGVTAEDSPTGQELEAIPHPDEGVAEKKPKRKKKGERHDWDKIRTLFVEGVPDGADGRSWLTLKEISIRTGVGYPQIRNQSSAQNWTALRSAYQVRLEKERQAKRAKEMAGEAIEFDKRSLSIAKAGSMLIQQRLGEIVRRTSAQAQIMEQAQKELAEGKPVAKERLYSAVNYREMTGLAQAAQMFQQMGRTALGEDVIRHEISGEVTVGHEHSVSEQLLLDDPERLGKLIAAMEDAKMLPGQISEVLQPFTGSEEDANIQDAEVVYEDE